MKTISIKVIATSILLVFLSINSYSQVATPAKTATKSKAKLDKTKVPKAVTQTFTIDYPVTDYDYWYGYDPYFYDNWKILLKRIETGTKIACITIPHLQADVLNTSNSNI